MSIVAHQRIVHFDRPAKRRDHPGLARAEHRALVKFLRGSPSGNLSSDYVREEIQVRRAERRGEDVSQRLVRLAAMRLRERMLERKRLERALAKAVRRPSIKHKINQAFQLREFIRVHAERLDSQVGLSPAAIG